MTITLTNLLQCDYVIIKNSGESFRNEMKSAEGVSRKQICKSLRQKDGGKRMFTQINNLINWLDAVVWGLPLSFAGLGGVR